jgi:hypothetical protein
MIIGGSLPGLAMCANLRNVVDAGAWGLDRPRALPAGELRLRSWTYWRWASAEAALAAQPPGQCAARCRRSQDCPAKLYDKLARFHIDARRCANLRREHPSSLAEKARRRPKPYQSARSEQMRHVGAVLTPDTANFRWQVHGGV